jgi:hypothetical protein
MMPRTAHFQGVLVWASCIHIAIMLARAQEPPFSEVHGGEFEAARIVARVGNEVILLGDVLGPIELTLAPYKGKYPEDELDRFRQQLVRQQVRVAAENKLLYLAFLREIPPERRGEALPKIWQEVYRQFEEKELPKLMERFGVTSAAELDARFREFGWSLAKQQRMFGERTIGMAGVAQKIKLNPEVTHEEMLRYYNEHIQEYSFPAKARWEELAVRFDRFPTRQAAYAAIVAMGNEVALGGAPLWAVAKRSSQGFTAAQGGQHDWTTQGSLASEALDRALFELPIGQLSQIIETPTGFHIIRVLERHEAGRTPFTQVQKEIKKKIQEQKQKEAFAQYVAQLRREIPVWTVFDDDPDPMPAPSGESR